MSKFILTKIDGSDEVKHTFHAEHLDDVIFSFQEFLRGCGFYFNGEVQIVDDPFVDRFITPYEDPLYDYDEDFVNSDSVVSSWSWTVNELSEKSNQNSYCEKCSFTKEEMEGSRCWDENCGLK